MTTPPIDEMVDGRGGLRPHWRALLGVFSTLGERGLADRMARMDEAFAQDGITTMLPGTDQSGYWRCDPVPLPLAAAEFADLEAGLKQRAHLLEAILQDIYGPQNLLTSGLLPPALVFTNPAFLRPCRVSSAEGTPRFPLLHYYAADLLRGPDGAWRVLADRTAAPSGIAYARENRRVLGRVVPEAFRPLQLRRQQSFFDTWQDSLQRLAPPGRANPAIGLLTQGPGHAGWFEQLQLSRELGCTLVELGDLSLRGGALYLKTLRGLQPIDTLLRFVDGRLIDPLEFEAQGAGVAGLMAAIRARAVRLLNDPGSGVAEAPALAAFLPQLCLHLLGEPLALASLPTLWLGSPRARTLVAAEPARWLVRPATDGKVPAIVPADLDETALADLTCRIAARGWDYAATASMPPSQAPSVTSAGLAPRPVLLRMFLIFDGQQWHVMPGGLAQVVDESTPLAGKLPRMGIAKDVWVMAEEGQDIVGPAALLVPNLPIRRAAGELPSRVADNLFWFGRYMERLEDHARLIRAALRRIGRGTISPRDLTELRALARCLQGAGLIDPAVDPAVGSHQQLAFALLNTVKEGGQMPRLLARVARLLETVRDRLTDDMYATFAHMEREARTACLTTGQSLDRLDDAMHVMLRFAAAVAGVAAENMVRGGGWLFLDLGRRIERGLEISAELALALKQPIAQIESGLRLALELCDSAITYRHRYLTVLQPAPVLDLVLADPSNPRALAFQLADIATRLIDLTGAEDDDLVQRVRGLQTIITTLVADIAASPEPASLAAALPGSLRVLNGDLVTLADQLARRYFILLPTPQSLGMPAEEPASLPPSLRGAA